MKLFFFIFIIILVTGCSQNKGVYWCGDHACINKNEKEAYFKKTMIVERRIINKKDIKNTSELEKISNEMKQKQKQIKKKQKKKAKSEKDLQKETKIKDNLKKKLEKELEKQIELNEKSLAKKKIEGKKTQNELDKLIAKDKIKISNSSEFDLVVENIKKKNMEKAFPDINDIPK